MNELLVFVVDPPEEPPILSVVLDRDEHAWQNHTGGWACTVHWDGLEDVEWLALGVQYGPLRVLYSTA